MVKEKDVYTFIAMDTIGSRKSDEKIEQYLRKLDRDEANDILSDRNNHCSLFDSFIRKRAETLTLLLKDLNLIKDKVTICAGDEVHIACDYKDLLTLIKYLKLYLYPLNFRIGISIGTKNHDLYLKHLEHNKLFVNAMKKHNTLDASVSDDQLLKALDYCPCELKIERRAYRTLKFIKDVLNDERLIYINQEDNRKTRHLNSILNELNDCYYDILIKHHDNNLGINMFDSKSVSILEEKFNISLSKLIYNL